MIRSSLSTRIPTGLVVELEHLKIKTRLTNEKFASVKGECGVGVSVNTEFIIINRERER